MAGSEAEHPLSDLLPLEASALAVSPHPELLPPEASAALLLLRREALAALARRRLLWGALVSARLRHPLLALALPVSPRLRSWASELPLQLLSLRGALDSAQLLHPPLALALLASPSLLS